MATYSAPNTKAKDGGDGSISRRDVLKSLAVGAAGAGLGFGFHIQRLIAQDSGTADKVLAFYRFNVGEHEVTVINDGFTGFPPAFLAVNAPEEEVVDVLTQHNLQADFVPLPMGTVLIRNSERLVLLDTGAGASSFIRESIGENTGSLPLTLSLLGIQPDEITDVIFSHYHPDHVGGASSDGHVAFPNAQHHLPQIEWDFLQSDGTVDFLVPFVEFANAQLQPVVANDGQLIFFSDEDEVVPGIQAIATLGHSIGHHSFMIESGSEQLLLVFDAITHPILSLQNPGWVSAVDQIPDLTVETRHRLLGRIADQQMRILAYHFPFPGVGTIMRDGEVYRYTPTS